MARKLSLVFGLVFLVVFFANSLVLAGARWDFSSSVENFTSRGNASIKHSKDGNGRMYMDTYGNDPGTVRSGLSINGSENNLFKTYIWTYCPDKTCELFFKRSGSSSIYSGGSVYLSNGSSGGEYVIDLSSNSNWRGTIAEVRIDPASSCGTLNSPGFVAFDWIAFEQKNGSITGGVRDDVTDSPINNALVRLEQNSVIKYSAYSNSTGNYVFNDVKPGIYNLVSLKFGFDNWTKSVTIGSNQVSQNIKMVPNIGSITGGVRDDVTKIPINSALIRLEQNSVVKYSAYSNSIGNYEFNGIAAGLYDLVSIKYGYCNWIKSVSITAGNQTSQNIAMPPETVSMPGIPAGNIKPIIGKSYRYATSGSNACIGHDIEYRFNWDDGTYSNWSEDLFAYKIWTKEKESGFDVQAEARCKVHTGKYAKSEVYTVYPERPNTPPTINITNPKNGTVFSATVNVSGTANDTDKDEEVKLVEVRVNSGSWQTAKGTENWSLDITLTDGANTIEARAKDERDLFSEISVINVIYDSTNPKIVVKHNFTEFPNGSSYNFEGAVQSKVAVGSYKDNDFIIANIGNDKLIIGKVSINSDQFEIVSQPALSISPGKSAFFTIRFKPTSIGEKNAEIVFSNNDLNNNPFKIFIKANAVNAEIIVKSLTVVKESWYQLFEVGPSITIRAEAKGETDYVDSIDVKISSNFTKPDGKIFAGALKRTGQNKLIYEGEVQVNSEIVNNEKGADEKEELFFIENDRDLQDIDEYKGVGEENSHGQNFLNSITKIPKKSIASANGNRAKNIPPATLEYFNSGGFETVTIETSNNNSSAKDVIFVKNQADWMIYTGHGSSCSAEIKLRNSDTLVGASFSANGYKWTEDLDGVLMFCCSILDLDDLNDNYPTLKCWKRNPNPGLVWKNSIDLLNGPKILLGFNFTAPLVVGYGEWTLELWQKDWLGGDSALEAWRKVTHVGKEQTMNSCAIDLENRKYWYRIVDDSIFSKPVIGDWTGIDLDPAEDGGTGGGFYEPENLVASAVSSSQINLSWNRGLNPENDNLRYAIFRWKLNDHEYIDSYKITSETNYQDIGLEPSTTYYYLVGVFIGDIEPTFSEFVNATTLDSSGGGGGGDNKPPSAPKDLRIINF